MSKNISKEIYYTICLVGNASYLAANNGFLKDGLKKRLYSDKITDVGAWKMEGTVLTI